MLTRAIRSARWTQTGICLDPYLDSLTGLSPEPDRRVSRGGSFDCEFWPVRVTRRAVNPRSYKEYDTGVRPARPIE